MAAGAEVWIPGSAVPTRIGRVESGRRTPVLHLDGVATREAAADELAPAEAPADEPIPEAPAADETAEATGAEKADA